jgi:hypothetical protein
MGNGMLLEMTYICNYVVSMNLVDNMYLVCGGIVNTHPREEYIYSLLADAEKHYSRLVHAYREMLSQEK